MHKHSVTVNGKTFTRNSETRTYTHAILVQYRLQRTEGSPRVLDNFFTIRGWAGTEQLALKQASALMRKPHIAQVHMVPNGWIGDLVLMTDPEEVAGEINK